jgi:hypothetical protein
MQPSSRTSVLGNIIALLRRIDLFKRSSPISLHKNPIYQDHLTQYE